MCTVSGAACLKPGFLSMHILHIMLLAGSLLCRPNDKAYVHELVRMLPGCLELVGSIMCMANGLDSAVPSRMLCSFSQEAMDNFGFCSSTFILFVWPFPDVVQGG